VGQAVSDGQTACPASTVIHRRDFLRVYSLRITGMQDCSGSKRVTCAEKVITSADAAGLPLDLLEGVVGRLGWFAFLVVLSVPFVQVLMRRLQPAWALRSWEEMPLAWCGVIAVMIASAAICALAWARALPPRLLLDLGLLYEVLGALCIALMEHAVPWPAGIPVRGISWTAVWIAIFSLVVPSTPGKTALAAIASAAMSPVGLMLHLLITGLPAPPDNVLLVLFFPNFLAATWVVVLGRFVYRLGARASKAHELGSYRLIEPIGEGGMGEVWRAEHRMLARTSAIKLIRPDRLAASPERAHTILHRFQREAQATARLRSPHTVELFDFGTTRDGSFYYVMEHLDGMDLETLVGRYGPVPAARAVHFLMQACDSLAEAHSQRLIHRDIKPKNLFVTRLGLAYDFIKVLDFGLVKSDGASDETQTRLTIEGIATGTPGYMAPEVALGKPADARSDLYALGCVAYWLLTGELVFDAETAMATALAHVQAPPVPPSQRTVMRIPEELERVVLQCLEKDPLKRPQSARELRRLLAGCGSGRWTPDDAECWWRVNADKPAEIETVAAF
jgi:serine/threonine-protein kinase